MFEMTSKKESHASLIIIVFLICIPFLSGLAYKYRNELKVKQRVEYIKEKILKSDTTVKMNMIAGVNDKDLRVVFNIPCKDSKTKQKILDNMTVIKHEMLMSMDNPENQRAIEKRNFKRIKQNYLEILQQHAPVDVDKVYIEFFAHN